MPDLRIARFERIRRLSFIDEWPATVGGTERERARRLLDELHARLEALREPTPQAGLGLIRDAIEQVDGEVRAGIGASDLGDIRDQIEALGSAASVEHADVRDLCDAAGWP